MREARILLLDFDPVNGSAESLKQILEASSGLKLHVRRETHCLSSTEPSRGLITKICSEFNPDVTFLILAAGALKRAGELIRMLKGVRPELPIPVVVEATEPEALLELLEAGASDFIVPPLRAVDVLPRVMRALEQVNQSENIVQTLKERLGLRQLVGESATFFEEIKKIPAVSRCNASVLISGETGTGKELCARAIHYLGSRANKPFVPVNCGAIPTELVENELFGHERGAFTGAATAQAGLIEEAEGGTLFLDEIDCLPLLAQVKLLRFLQEKEYRPLGSRKTRQADVRVIAATNVGLEDAVRAGRLRGDLYYRLNIIPLVLPPLRERRDDIPLLARHFLQKYAVEFGKQVTGFSDGALRTLAVYEWPGNVRELEHTVERAVVLAQQSIIQESEIVLSRLEPASPDESLQEAKAKVVERFEKSYIQALLVAYQGNITRAAQAAQKNRRAFFQLIRKHQIDVARFKPSTS